MSRQPITVELPEEVYDRLERTARGMRRPLNRVLATIVKAATPSLERVPAEFRGELERMESLADQELWKVARSELSAERHSSLTRLLSKQQGEALTRGEQQKLTRLLRDCDRLTLRRSYAYLLLKYRGHNIPAAAEMNK